MRGVDLPLPEPAGWGGRQGKALSTGRVPALHQLGTVPVHPEPLRVLPLLPLPPRERVLVGRRGCTAAGSKPAPAPSFSFKETHSDQARNTTKTTFKGQRNHLERRAAPARTSRQRGGERHARAPSLSGRCRPQAASAPGTLASERTFLQLTGSGPELGSVLCVQK